ncbi:hypothetical protein BSKO_08601 [Bryopsis sp. KO-2023]|nr:hypothetical protein BSKO_08601 [Bryopsis sp. KO-2023]
MPSLEFGALGLDARLLQGIKKKGYEAPTQVQSLCIPALLKGKDVVAIAKTGTGKTMAYLLPLVNGMLSKGGGKEGWEALVLVPTRELCLQVRDEAEELIKHCNFATKVTSMNLKGSDNLSMIVKSAGSIVAATPGQMSTVLESGALDVEKLQTTLKMLVVDEADLLMSYGYKKDISTLAPKIPRSCQCVLVSATKGKDLNDLQKLLLHNPIHLDLVGQQSKEEATDLVDHRHIACFDEDRLVCLLVLLKMNVVKRRVLIFVNSIPWAYKTRLFLEAFGVRGVVLHSELPLNSRHHILKQFNKGTCQHMIVADDTHSAPSPQPMKKRKREQDAEKETEKKPGNKDEEFGVTRGLDFQGVSTVLNLQLPDSPEGYIHRVGRTGRAGKTGTALTLLTPADSQFKAEINEDLKKRNSVEDEEQDMIRPFQAHITPHVEALRARCEDVLRGVTKKRVKQARVEDLKNELLNSERLETHFAAHPNDMNVLKHDAPIASTTKSHHLKKALPDYISVPDVMATTKAKATRVGKKLKGDPLRVRRRRGNSKRQKQSKDGQDGDGGGNSVETIQQTVGSKRRR